MIYDQELPEGYELVDPYADAGKEKAEEEDVELEEIYELPKEMPEDGYSVSDVLRAIISPKGDERTRASSSISYAVYDHGEQQTKEEGEYITTEACYNVERRGDFVYVSMRFDDELHPDLIQMWNLLCRYGEELHNNADSETYEPVLTLAVMPNSAPNVYMECHEPVYWTLQPKAPGEPATVIGMLFLNQDIEFEVTDIDAEEVERLQLEEMHEETKQLQMENKLIQDEIDRMEQEEYNMAGDFEDIVPGVGLGNEDEDQ